MIESKWYSDACRLIREQSPLVLNLTNYVAMNFSANALLAVGASPLMSLEANEMEELTAQCDACVINIGCLEAAHTKAMLLAAQTARKLGRPWVLDPVGVGASAWRDGFVRQLLEQKPTVIRGNASEILHLAGEKPRSRGVDAAVSSREAAQAGKRLALETGAVVSISGATDYITDGHDTVDLTGGSALMPQVTAMGCTASALTAAFVACVKPALTAAAGAMALMSAAGEAGAARCTGPGALAAAFTDAIWALSQPSGEVFQPRVPSPTC